MPSLFKLLVDPFSQLSLILNQNTSSDGVVYKPEKQNNPNNAMFFDILNIADLTKNPTVKISTTVSAKNNLDGSVKVARTQECDLIPDKKRLVEFLKENPPHEETLNLNPPSKQGR